ncbi:MAG TPA: NUDIX hydrolase [Candidatus Xenobia bacterium]
MSREGIPCWFFVVVLVRDESGRFLLVHEAKHGGGWYVPAGRVEAGETFGQAAQRETMEESGVPIHLEGILRIEHTPGPVASRMRVIYVAKPADDTPPRTTPNEHTLGAAWYSLDDMRGLDLRANDFIPLVLQVARGVPVSPVGLIGEEI